MFFIKILTNKSSLFPRFFKIAVTKKERLKEIKYIELRLFRKQIIIITIILQIKTYFNYKTNFLVH